MAAMAAGTWWTVPDSDDEDELLLDATAGLGRDPPAGKDVLAVIKEYCRQLAQGQKLCDLEYRGPRLAAAAPSPSPAFKAATAATASPSMPGGRRLGSLPARLAMTPGRRRRRIALPLQSLSGLRTSSITTSSSSQTTATMTSSSQLRSDGPPSSADADYPRPPEPFEEHKPSAFEFDLQIPTAATTLPPAHEAATNAGGMATQEDVDVALWLDAPSNAVRSTYGRKQRLRPSPVTGEEAGPAPATVPAPPHTPAPAPVDPLLTTPRTPAALMAIRGLDADDGDDLANILQFVQDDVRGSTSVRRSAWLNSDSHHGTSSQALSLSQSSLL